MIDAKILEYVADKVLDDFVEDLLPDDLAHLFSGRPWIDAIRTRVAAVHAGRVSVVLSRPNECLGLVNFALNVARGISCHDLVPSIWNTISISKDLAIKVSAMLLLASQGEMEGKWESQLAAIGEDKEKLLKVAMTFYECDTLDELADAVRRRIGKYPYNRPYYDYILSAISIFPRTTGVTS
jgi:hypothetical protein